MLHAMTLKFDHPVTGIEMEFHSEIPQDFAAILEKCS